MLQGEKVYSVSPRDAAEISSYSTSTLSEMVRRGQLTSKVVETNGPIGRMNMYCMDELIVLREKKEARKAEKIRQKTQAADRAKRRIEAAKLIHDSIQNGYNGSNGNGLTFTSCGLRNDVHAAVKEKADRTGKSMTAVASDWIQLAITIERNAASLMKN